MSKVRELFGYSTGLKKHDWSGAVAKQECPFLGRKCLKNRKSEPEIAIGTCTVTHGEQPVAICPHRFLERGVLFTDCLTLIRHEPGNELHIIPEVGIPGGTVDVKATVKKHEEYKGRKQTVVSRAVINVEKVKKVKVVKVIAT